MKKLIAMVTLMMVALCAMALTAGAENLVNSAALEMSAPVAIVNDVEVAEEDGEIEILEEVELDEEAEVTEEANEIEDAETFDFDSLPIMTQEAEEPAAQVEEEEAEVLLSVEESDIDGLEIVIIDNPEVEAEDGAVVIEEDEDETGLEIMDEDDAEEMTFEDDVVPLAGPAMVAVDRQVNVRSNLGACVNENDKVTLTGELIGFDGCDVTLQWQVYNGSEWQDIEGANGMEYSFAATNESVNSAYRLAVAING